MERETVYAFNEVMSNKLNIQMNIYIIKVEKSMLPKCLMMSQPLSERNERK